jgi:GntR family transcriptional regulator/MocR family aminotransferase
MAYEDTAALAALALEPAEPEPLYMQIYEQVRDLILAGRLGSGARLPSTRALAADLGVSRTTTLAAYDQLSSEGYIEGHRGSGAFVAAELPEALLSVAAATAARPPRGIAPAPPPARIAAFDAGVPDTRGFPFRDWSRHLARCWRAPSPAMLHTAHSYGDAALRAAIARHVKAVRGIACDPEQVIVTSGAAESIAILARALFEDGDGAVVEDPCYPVAHGALARAGLRPHSVEVDAEGLLIEAIPGPTARLRAALVTPSRQYPLGMTMSVSRRLELLDWASRTGALVIEDDYDSEYRYTGRPLAAMMSLDQAGRVVYLGSFSKIMFRSLRLAYIIAPPALLGRLHVSLAEQPSQASLVPQRALAAFMDSGAFAQHVRRTRRLYAERCAALHGLISSDMADLLTAPRTDSGMHLTAHFTPALSQRLTDTDAAALARRRGVVVSPLSVHYRKAPAKAGFLMGFAGFEAAELKRGMRALRAALEPFA